MIRLRSCGSTDRLYFRHGRIGQRIDPRKRWHRRLSRLMGSKRSRTSNRSLSIAHFTSFAYPRRDHEHTSLSERSVPAFDRVSAVLTRCCELEIQVVRKVRVELPFDRHGSIPHHESYRADPQNQKLLSSGTRGNLSRIGSRSKFSKAKSPISPGITCKAQ